jgi:hypothetical protein
LYKHLCPATTSQFHRGRLIPRLVETDAPLWNLACISLPGPILGWHHSTPAARKIIYRTRNIACIFPPRTGGFGIRFKFLYKGLGGKGYLRDETVHFVDTGTIPRKFLLSSIRPAWKADLIAGKAFVDPDHSIPFFITR